jgi:DNA-binding MarR family transcriptional regulator
MTGVLATDMIGSMSAVDADELAGAAAFRSELRRFLQRSDQLAAEFGLTPQRYDLLLQVKASPGGRSSVTELSRRLHLRQTAVTELVKRAEEAGLVRRARSQTDRRVVLIALTEDGDQRVTRVFDALWRDRVDLAKALTELDSQFRALSNG